MAVLEDSEESTVILLQNGSNTSIRDTDGLTPLALCQISKNERLEMLLRDHEEQKDSDDVLPSQQKYNKKVNSKVVKIESKTTKKKDHTHRRIAKRGRQTRKRKKPDSVCSTSSTPDDSRSSLSPEIKLPFCESSHRETNARKRQWSEVDETQTSIVHGYTSDECLPYKEIPRKSLPKHDSSQFENVTTDRKKTTKKCKIDSKKYPSVDFSTDDLEESLSNPSLFDFGFKLSSMLSNSPNEKERMFEDDVFVGSNVLHQALTSLIDPLPTLGTPSWSTDGHSPISESSL